MSTELTCPQSLLQDKTMLHKLIEKNVQQCDKVFNVLRFLRQQLEVLDLKRVLMPPRPFGVCLPWLCRVELDFNVSALEVKHRGAVIMLFCKLFSHEESW